MNQIFALFKEYNIVIKIIKTYFEYSSMLLLNQRVDNFELLTIEKKIKIIRKLNFFRTFKNLKTYLNKTKYLRQYIAYYTQKTKLLQQKIF